MNIEWDNKFELGHEQIDAEHKIFLGLISYLDRCVSDNTPKERVASHLTELDLYAKFHFKSEENLMEEINYPDLKAHKEEHLQLLALYENCVYEFLHENKSLIDIVNYLFEWFALHTTNSDMALVKYMNR